MNLYKNKILIDIKNVLFNFEIFIMFYIYFFLLISIGCLYIDDIKINNNFL